MEIQRFSVGNFQVNTYLVTDPATGVSAVIDTGETEELVKALSEMTPSPRIDLILLTHAHLDHAGALPLLQQHLPNAKTYLPRLELEFFRLLPQQALRFGFDDVTCGRIDVLVDEGDEISVGESKLRFLSTPGHTPGMGCFYDATDVFVGDTLFQGSIGRTDFPMSDPLLMKESLRKLMSLPPQLRVHPGHGPSTTLEEELARNPFLAYIREERGIRGMPGIRWW